jgi:phospholipid/cholesterol/gamma-HCH transport system substrate-binding protein
MLIKSDMNGVIRKNAIVSLGADGIMGNKVINIVPGPSPNAPLAENNDLLCVEKSVDIDDILKTIAQTGGHVNDISRELKATIARVNASDGLWKLLSDSGMALSLKRSLANIERATGNADEMTVELQQILSDFREGEVMGLMNDTLLTSELHGTLRDLQATASTARHLATELDTTLATLNRNINQGPGTVNLVLNDTAVEGNIRRTLQNVEKGSSYFNENMEAMRHNFLFRGYFKKQEKQKAKQQKDSLAN